MSSVYLQALEKSKYEQSLETVRRFIAISEKELELYYRHVALYGKPQPQNADLAHGGGIQASSLETEDMKHGKDQAFSDVDIMDTSESDEEHDSSSESDANDVATGDATDSPEDTDVSDHQLF
uniref:Uncharacterized protein n=1 Tax=Aegilops tauschii subsp. strangulata TaxID=200361 RepID=A0A453GQU0_AEGTS